MIKDFFKNNNYDFLEDAPLINYNTYHINAKAKFLVFPNNVDELINLVKYLKENNIEYIFLGNGSNIILANSYYDKVFIKLDKINYIKIDKNIVTAGAGVSLIKLALDCALANLSGLEFACAIPGLVGASTAMNAGAYNSSIKDILVSAKVLTPNLEIKEFKTDDLNYEYRDSFLKKNKDYVCLEATFKLEEKDSEEILELMSSRQERRIDTQPLSYPSAGSVFRNPTNLYAGELIENCGLKGTNINGAEVSEKHANFIINKKDAKGSDIIELINTVKKQVKDKYNIDLILEQEIIR